MQSKFQLGLSLLHFLQFFQAISLRRIERVPYELKETNSRSFLELMLFTASFEDSMTKLVKHNQLNIFLEKNQESAIRAKRDQS